MPLFDPTTKDMVPLSIDDADKGLKSGYWRSIDDFRAKLVEERLAQKLPPERARIIPVIRRGSSDASDIRFFDIGRYDLPPNRRKGANADHPGSQEFCSQLLSGMWRIATDEELKENAKLREEKLAAERAAQLAKDNLKNAESAASTAAATAMAVQTAIAEVLKHNAAASAPQTPPTDKTK